MILLPSFNVFSTCKSVISSSQISRR
jgi:hypothetical protein